MSAEAWDAVVGIPLADWMRADTPEQVEWLAWLRDHPLPEPPLGEPIAEIYDFAGQVVRTVRRATR